jgi:uncharacterized protein YjgD (DUF1641 family)
MTMDKEIEKIIIRIHDTIRSLKDVVDKLDSSLGVPKLDFIYNYMLDMTKQLSAAFSMTYDDRFLWLLDDVQDMMDKVTGLIQDVAYM